MSPAQTRHPKSSLDPISTFGPFLFRRFLPLLPPLLFSLLLSPSDSLGQADHVDLVSGDVTLGAIFSVNNYVQGDQGCGDYNIDTLKEVVAAQWFLRAVNDMDYVPGVRIGLDVYRTCQSGERATRSAVHILENYNVLDEDTQDINTTQPLLGILGPGRTQEAIMVSRFISSLPSKQRPVLISGSATGAALKDSTVHSSFYRVIPPDSTQVQVLLKLLVQLGWNYISIVYDDDAYGVEAATQLRDLALRVDLCVPSFYALPLDYRSQDFLSITDAIIDSVQGSGDSSIITGVVFIGSAATAKEFLGRMATQVNYVRFVFSEALALQTSVVSGNTLGKGALAAAPPYLHLPEFGAFWNSIWSERDVFLAEVQKNPWLADYYLQQTSCPSVDDLACWTQAQQNTPLPLIQDDTQWLFEYYQVKATAMFAHLLKKLHADTCGEEYRGACLRLKELLRSDRLSVQVVLDTSWANLEEEFSNVTYIFQNQTHVGFDAEGEIASGSLDNSLYNVFNYRACDGADSFCFQKVGTYSTSGVLDLNTGALRGYTDSGDALMWPDFPKSQCMVGHDCLDCIPAGVASQVILVPGDFYIVAIGPVYEKLAGQPLKCGGVRTSAGADMLHSVLFAVEEINKKRNDFTGIFGSASLGVLIFNSCSRELVVNDKLIALHKGTLPLPDGRNSSDILPYIAGYVGAYFSSVSVSVYEFLASLDTRFVMLSPANTSPELSDRSKYPLYLRLPPGSDTQVRGLLTLVRELGHQYVQVVYDPDDVYTLTIKERVNTLSSLKSFNICVVNNIVSDDEDSNFYSILDNLRKNDWAPLVIVAMQADHVRRVMTDIVPQMTSTDRYRFLSFDGWGRGAEILRIPRASRLLGSLLFSSELPLNQLFNEYLRNTDPLNSVNPWLKYFWEAREQCYFDSSFQRKDKTGVCPADLTNGYIQDTYIPFYINAVYIFALGLNAAMLKHCEQISLCDTLSSENLRKAIGEVRYDLVSTGVDVDVFDANGDGEVGYKIFQVSFDTSTADTEDMEYEEVGRYERDSLSLYRENVWILDNLSKSHCPNSKACNACFPLPPVGPGSSDDQEDDGVFGPLIGTVIVIVLLLIALVVLAVLLFLACRRLKARRAHSHEQGEKFAFDNLSGPGSGDSRPLPPIHDSSVSYSPSVGSGSGSGGDQTHVDAYDYLHSVDPTPHSAHSSHAYLAQGQNPRGVSGGGSSVRNHSLTGSYLSHNAAHRLSYESTHSPYNRFINRGAPAPPPPSVEGGSSNSGGRPGDSQTGEGRGQQRYNHMGERRPGEEEQEEGGQQNGQPQNWRRKEIERLNSQLEDLQREEEEGGQRNSQPEDWRREPEEGGQRYSFAAAPGDSGWGFVPQPVVFENIDMSDSGSLQPPEPCRSTTSSGYLTPFKGDDGPPSLPQERSLPPGQGDDDDDDY